MNSYKFLALLALPILAFSSVSCTDTLEEIQISETEKYELPESFVAVIPQMTRTTHTSSGDNIKTTWEIGDKITISPAHLSSYANVYKLTSAIGSKGTFTKESGVDVSTNSWGVYYPGDKIKSDIDFYNFSYTGQVQQKTDPMGHLDGYHSMMLGFTGSGSGVFPSTDDIDFSGAQQSSCIKLVLSGQTFDTPQSISISAVNSNGFVDPVFYESNVARGSFFGDDTKVYQGEKNTSVLSLDLSGYGTETGIEAYMMASNAPVTLPNGGYLLIRVKCATKNYFCRVPIKSDVSLQAGKVLTIKTSGKWYEDNIPYDNTHYAYDGEVVTLQTASVAKGLDLVIMGDGFIAEDFTNSTYNNIMNQAYEAFFEIQPFQQLKHLFNVYYVKAVSPQRLNPSAILVNGADGNGAITKFSSVIAHNATTISGNNSLANEYAKKAFATDADERIKNATVVVMVNANCHAGTCHNQYESGLSTDYGEANAVAYCALGTDDADRKHLMYHEICGHGFGKLADEYYYTGHNIGNTGPLNELKEHHLNGRFRNADCYVNSYIQSITGWDITTTSNVYWHDLFGTTNNYETKENLGIYEGAYTYEQYFCRPTEDGNKSIMNHNTGCFNAISRRQILYRALRLTDSASFSYGTNAELESFLTWDKNNFTYPGSGETRANVVEKEYVLDPPVWIEGSWINGHFVEALVAE